MYLHWLKVELFDLFYNIWVFGFAQVLEMVLRSFAEYKNYYGEILLIDLAPNPIVNGIGALGWFFI